MFLSLGLFIHIYSRSRYGAIRNVTQTEVYFPLMMYGFFAVLAAVS